MTRVICDQCRKEVEPNIYGLSPDGWLRVDLRGVYPGVSDYCSHECAIGALEIRIANRRDATFAAAAEAGPDPAFATIGEAVEAASHA